MALKKHHKIIIGSFSSLVIMFMIVTGILFVSLFAKQEINYNQLQAGITDVNSKISELTAGLINTQTELSSLGTQIVNIDEEFDLLKASAGEDFSGIIEDSVRAVVTIRTDVGQGTGFLITNDGYVVTNAHVLVGGREVQAITYSQTVEDAYLVGYDGDLDIALLKIEGNYEKLRLTNSNNIDIGEKVIAIGNPLGLQFSVTEGIVSGIHRTGPNGEDAYIQTDAALNPGNSGGPLIDKEGKVIGINNFKAGSGENIGFALESNYIEDAVNNIYVGIYQEELI
ncbi:S1C family serine protease [Nanoarchaeota archaeon]